MYLNVINTDFRVFLIIQAFVCSMFLVFVSDKHSIFIKVTVRSLEQKLLSFCSVGDPAEVKIKQNSFSKIFNRVDFVYIYN